MRKISEFEKVEVIGPDERSLARVPVQFALNGNDATWKNVTVPLSAIVNTPLVLEMVSASLGGANQPVNSTGGWNVTEILPSQIASTSNGFITFNELGLYEVTVSLQTYALESGPNGTDLPNWLSNSSELRLELQAGNGITIISPNRVSNYNTIVKTLKVSYPDSGYANFLPSVNLYESFLFKVDNINDSAIRIDSLLIRTYNENATEIFEFRAGVVVTKLGVPPSEDGGGVS